MTCGSASWAQCGEREVVGDLARGDGVASEVAKFGELTRSCGKILGSRIRPLTVT